MPRHKRACRCTHCARRAARLPHVRGSPHARELALISRADATGASARLENIHAMSGWTVQPVAHCASSTVGLTPPHHRFGREDGSVRRLPVWRCKHTRVREAPYRSFKSDTRTRAAHQEWRRSYPWASCATRGGSTPGAAPENTDHLRSEPEDDVGGEEVEIGGTHRYCGVESRSATVGGRCLRA